MMLDAKILSPEALASASAALRRAGKKLVFTNGCFDLLHRGHVRYLQAARQLGDALAVGINGDDSVRAQKGTGRPVNREADRAAVIAALASVDFVVVFPEVRATKLLEQARPAIYAKGGDYTLETLDAEERAALAELGAEIHLIPFEAGYSTTDLIERLQASELKP